MQFICSTFDTININVLSEQPIKQFKRMACHAPKYFNQANRYHNGISTRSISNKHFPLFLNLLLMSWFKFVLTHDYIYLAHETSPLQTLRYQSSKSCDNVDWQLMCVVLDSEVWAIVYSKSVRLFTTVAYCRVQKSENTLKFCSVISGNKQNGLKKKNLNNDKEMFTSINILMLMILHDLLVNHFLFKLKQVCNADTCSRSFVQNIRYCLRLISSTEERV